MDIILKYWYAFVIIIAVIAVAIILVIKYIKKLEDMTPEQLEAEKKKVEQWALQACMYAEKMFGGGTGKLKFSTVYDLFVKAFPWLVKYITINEFNDIVDKALTLMRDMIENNTAIQAIVSAETVIK